MCIIIDNKKANKIDTDILERCVEFNQDGYAFYDIEKNNLIKTFDGKEMLKLISQKIPYVAHCRKATVGAKKIENIHLFEMGDWLVAMNGTITGLSCRTTNDTLQIVEAIKSIPSEHYEKLLNIFESRFLLINKNTKEVIRTGKWTEKTGTFYSKTNVLYGTTNYSSNNFTSNRGFYQNNTIPYTNTLSYNNNNNTETVVFNPNTNDWTTKSKLNTSSTSSSHAQVYDIKTQTWVPKSFKKEISSNNIVEIKRSTPDKSINYNNNISFNIENFEFSDTFSLKEGENNKHIIAVYGSPQNKHKILSILDEKRVIGCGNCCHGFRTISEENCKYLSSQFSLHGEAPKGVLLVETDTNGMFDIINEIGPHSYSWKVTMVDTPKGAIRAFILTLHNDFVSNSKFKKEIYI